MKEQPDEPIQELGRASNTGTHQSGIPSEFRRDSVAAWRASALSVPKFAGQIGVN